jgi:lipopolysaccharide transport system ATP-binding protein
MGYLAHDVNRWWHSVLGKPDPYLKLGEENDRSIRGESDYVWALRDISFKVNQGEVLGIIGRNGAGKSTLLKLLSRTTGPTTGTIKVKGRIASLLEVGTGFHPELTGRENIFLNGAILGMTRAEIARKFEEIVDFSGVEKYVDTPVKRYSSGMYVRLAFAVAAHLEPEILVIDEVLAVGDIEFQKKCLGKMQNVSHQGRTVLFVSHNMGAIQNLCQSSIVLKNGKVVFSGDVKKGVDHYLSLTSHNSARSAVDLTSLRRPEITNGSCYLTRVSLYNSGGAETSEFKFGEIFSIRVEVNANEKVENLSVLIAIDSFDERRILTCYSEDSRRYLNIAQGERGLVEARFDSLALLPGQYKVSLGIHRGKMGSLDVVMYAISFTVSEISENEGMAPFKGNSGILKIDPKWR